MPSALQMILNASHLSTLCATQVPRAGCISVSNNEMQALDFIDTHTAPGESIFVGNARHDQIFVSDVMFYFLADRRSATKQYDLIPGWATTLAVQQSIIEDLKKARVRYIVLFGGTESVGEGVNQSTTDGGATALDDFIRQNFERVAQFDEYSIWKLNEAPASD
jgi:hypothetical protein